jgi:hypothetical protein
VKKVRENVHCGDFTCAASGECEGWATHCHKLGSGELPFHECASADAFYTTITAAF